MYSFIFWDNCISWIACDDLTVYSYHKNCKWPKSTKYAKTAIRPIEFLNVFLPRFLDYIRLVNSGWMFFFFLLHFAKFSSCEHKILIFFCLHNFTQMRHHLVWHITLYNFHKGSPKFRWLLSCFYGKLISLELDTEFIVWEAITSLAFYYLNFFLLYLLSLPLGS